ncbi:c-type cytochrome [Trinickia fusca]|uniref:Cytochrome c n=1 Tax=Trinickia fusca TaxID=2419777 RepID=A0A494X040_9BURK|nr:cytochrome c [Trinickia fusca]RKP43672.1 cytochrome c [Trinickia fusca]
MPLRRLWLCLLACALPLHAAELKLDLDNGDRVVTTEQLLVRPDARSVTVPADLSFHREMHYRAVPLAALLAGVKPGTRLQFVAADGFAVDIDADLIRNHKGAQAWLAIEDPQAPWPPLPTNKGHAGPFYVVWTHPEAAGVSDEQWPYQLAQIRRTLDGATKYPATAPDASVPADGAIRRGYAVFQRTCFACHTLNGEGDSHMGPDLNVPHNPTEYLRADMLRAFIRDPQSLRRWPEAKMKGFPTQASLSDADLDDVLAYLRHMALHKADH